MRKTFDLILSAAAERGRGSGRGQEKEGDLCHCQFGCLFQAAKPK